MAVNTYKAQLNYYDHTLGGAMWAHARRATAAVGRGFGRTGVMYFPGLSNLKGKIINSVKITVTNRAGGQNRRRPRISSVRHRKAASTRRLARGTRLAIRLAAVTHMPRRV